MAISMLRSLEAESATMTSPPGLSSTANAASADSIAPAMFRSSFNVLMTTETAQPETSAKTGGMGSVMQ